MRLKTIRTAIAVALLGAAIGATYLGLGAAQATRPSAAPFRRLVSAPAPPGLRDAIPAIAKKAGIDPAAVSEAGVAAPGTPYRSTLVGTDHSGRIWVAFASAYSTTSFSLASSLFAHRPMVVLQGTRGTPSQLREVGFSVVVNASVTRVELETAGGSTNSLLLTRWPNTPYASASVSATSKEDFPKTVRAYNAAGRLVDVQQVDLTPIQP